jgi:hypothetical protein
LFEITDEYYQMTCKRESDLLALPFAIVVFLGAMGGHVIQKSRPATAARESGVPIPQEELPVAYSDLASRAMDGQPVGSSAGGEQPKFTASIERAGEILDVLVKVSPPVETIEGRRWADLLVCEHP